MIECAKNYHNHNVKRYGDFHMIYIEMKSLFISVINHIGFKNFKLYQKKKPFISHHESKTENLLCCQWRKTKNELQLNAYNKLSTKLLSINSNLP